METNLRFSEESSKKYKKGDLQITVFEAKELPLTADKKPFSVYCVVDITGTTPQKTDASTNGNWNQKLTFDIMTLDETEALIQVYGKSESSKDKFLGQINIPLKVLDIPPDPEWHYLSDRPSLLKHESSDLDLRELTGGYISGAIQLGFKFTHRLIRERTLIREKTARMPLTSLFDLSHTVQTPAVMEQEIAELQHITEEAAIAENPDKCKSESVIVEESVKEKELKIYETLSRKKQLFRTMSIQIEKMEKAQGKESVRFKKQEMEQFERELEAVETTLKIFSPPPTPPPAPGSRLSSPAISPSITPLSPPHPKPTATSPLSPPTRPPLPTSPLAQYSTTNLPPVATLSPAPTPPLTSAPPPSSSAPAPQLSLANEVEFLRLKVELLQKELEKQQQVTAVVNTLMGKLEKLDKLDEIMRRLDNMKVAPGGFDGGSGSSYAELKAQLEELQIIIFDETGKYSEKEKEDANIRFEKTYAELAKTSEHREEVARIKEEKRRINEPLNREALARMVKIYTPDAIRNNEEIKNKVASSPELALIGMDPKAILAKHQNDFANYALLITDMDELRAICASLPKFRNDQKRQLDFLETLENKIEQYMKDPPKPKKIVKAKVLKIKKPAAGAPPGDMFSELLAKRKEVKATN